MAVTAAVMCSDEVVASASAQKGAHPVGSAIGSPNGIPPSGSEIVASQSHSSTARSVRNGAASANASNAWSAPAGWLSGARQSGSRPQP